MSDSGQPVPVPNSHWTSARVAIIAELVVVGMIFVADYYRWHHVIVISKTLYLFVLALVALKGSDLEVGRLGLVSVLGMDAWAWSVAWHRK